MIKSEGKIIVALGIVYKSINLNPVRNIIQLGLHYVAIAQSKRQKRQHNKTNVLINNQSEKWQAYIRRKIHKSC